MDNAFKGKTHEHSYLRQYQYLHCTLDMTKNRELDVIELLFQKYVQCILKGDYTTPLGPPPTPLVLLTTELAILLNRMSAEVICAPFK